MKLTGYDIDLIREVKPFEEYEEIELIDIRDDLGSDIYDILINHRYDTTLEVINAGKEKLLEIEDFDEETVDKILAIIDKQYEEE
jgi:N utilization substance protein A